jgi:hypothetical protein
MIVRKHTVQVQGISYLKYNRNCPTSTALRSNARTNKNFTKHQIVSMSEVLAELFVRMLVSLRKVLLPILLEASVYEDRILHHGTWGEFCCQNVS